VSLGIGALSLFGAPRLAARFGPKATLVSGLTLMLAGLLWLFEQADVGASYVDVLPAFLAIGVGAGLGFPSMMTLAMSGATPSDAGLASGLVNTTQQVGGALGLAVLATLATERTDAVRAGGAAPLQALTEGYQLAFGIGAVLLGTAIAVALGVLRSPAQERERAAVHAAEPATERV